MLNARAIVLSLIALGVAYGSQSDSDHDGLSDEFEQALLQKFAPRFRISAGDCDIAPAEFHAGLPDPRVKSKNGTIYGQVFPIRRGLGAGGFIEIHVYHLWAQDCGLTRHALDVEGVSALLQAENSQSPVDDWRATFWHSAAHEGTLCDMGNGATAAALGAVDQGPDVWVSRHKHGSFLSREVCSKGCGGDVCDEAGPMRISKLVNLGEPGAPMNGTIWSASTSWPLASKMTPRYTSALIARMPSGSQVELVPARNVVRGARSTIKVAGRTYQSLVAADARTTDSVASSAQHSARSLKAASAAARRFLKRAFRTGPAR